jgi:hypothetical protein
LHGTLLSFRNDLIANNHIEVMAMSREKKKPKQNKVKHPPPGQAAAAVEAANQPHNAKKEALGPNTKRG